MNKYRYKMILSPIATSYMASCMEGSNMNLVTKIEIECTSGLNEEEKIKELEDKKGSKTPDGSFEFVGFEDLVKVIK